MAKMTEDKLPLEVLCARYRKLFSGAICDVLDRLKFYNQWLHKDIKPLKHEMVVAGPAVTAKAICRPAWEGVQSPDLLEAIYPSCVLVVDPDKEQFSGHVGGVTANILHAKGCQGVVVDGGVRDSKQHLDIPNWGVFCRYTSPLEQGPRVSLLAMEKPIFLTGSLTSVVRVNPGDFIFGDSDGVVVIPREVVHEVLVQAEDIVARENKGIEEIRKGISFKDVVKKYHIG
jgi:regulator of RNase E activity RraA